MTRIHLVAEGTDVRGLEWNLRDDGDAVIALLPVQRDVLVAEPLEALQRKGVVDALGLLETQHVRPRALEKLRDQIDAQPHRIDVPGCQGKTHENCVLAWIGVGKTLVHRGSFVGRAKRSVPTNSL